MTRQRRRPALLRWAHDRVDKVDAWLGTRRIQDVTLAWVTQRMRVNKFGHATMTVKIDMHRLQQLWDIERAARAIVARREAGPTFCAPDSAELLDDLAVSVEKDADHHD